MSRTDEPSKEDTNPPRSQRRRGDTARFIERFAALTGFRVRSDNVAGLPHEFVTRRVQSPAFLVQEYGRELELRTRNALCQFDPGEREDSWTFGRLLEIRGFGVFSLLDVLEVLTRHHAHLKDG